MRLNKDMLVLNVNVGVKRKSDAGLEHERHTSQGKIERIGWNKRFVPLRVKEREAGLECERHTKSKEGRLGWNMRGYVGSLEFTDDLSGKEKSWPMSDSHSHKDVISLVLRMKTWEQG